MGHYLREGAGRRLRDSDAADHGLPQRDGKGKRQAEVAVIAAFVNWL